MLRGEHGRQVKELDRLMDFLGEQGRPDVVVLSNALLLGLAGRIRQRLASRVVCLLQDEEGFLDGLGERHSRAVWDLLRQRSDDVDLFVATSRFYAREMGERLGLDESRIATVPTGIDLEGYEPAAGPPSAPAIGFLSEMSRSKGLGDLVEAFIRLKGDSAHAELRLVLAGGQTAADEPLLAAVRGRLAEAGVDAHVEFLDRFDRQAKQEFLPRLSVLAVPTRQGEASGLYLLEALACGVPVVMPDHGCAAELVAATAGGLLHKPRDVADLADKIDCLLRDPPRAREMGLAGREAVRRDFDVERTARSLLEACATAPGRKEPS